MSSRVFISYRNSDGADKATALARDLDARFGDDQVFLDKEDLAPGSRWRDEIARTLGDSPVLLVLVTPNYLGALDVHGQRCIDRADDPARDELQAGIAADARIIPLLCDGVTAMPPATELPSPFDKLCELQWGRLRAFDWRADTARLAEDLGQLGFTTRIEAGAGPVTVPMPEPATAPVPFLPPGAARVLHDEFEPSGRRAALGLAAIAVLAIGGWSAWRWQQRRAANLSGPWRARIGARGAPNSRDGELMQFTLEQDGQTLRLTSSAVDIERNPEWQNYRDFWKQRTGNDLTRVFYRGEGKIFGEDDDETSAEAGSESVSGAPRARKPDPGRQTRPVTVRRVVIAIHIATPGSDSEAIDEGDLRGIVDAEDQRIHGRLRLNSERAERVVDLRRGSN